MHTKDCTHPDWTLRYIEEADRYIFGCNTETAKTGKGILIEDNQVIRSKVASFLGKLGGQARKLDADYSAMGKKGGWPKGKKRKPETPEDETSPQRN